MAKAKADHSSSQPDPAQVAAAVRNLVTVGLGPGDSIVLMNPLIALRSLYTLGLAPASPSWRLGLFVNSITPSCTDSLGLYTFCTLAGYADKVLLPSNWASSVSSCVVTQVYPPLTFILTAGGQTVYGHVVYDLGAGNLGWVHAYGTPIAIPPAGANITIGLTFQDKQG